MTRQDPASAGSHRTKPLGPTLLHNTIRPSQAPAIAALALLAGLFRVVRDQNDVALTAAERWLLIPVETLLGSAAAPGSLTAQLAGPLLVLGAAIIITLLTRPSARAIHTDTIVSTVLGVAVGVAFAALGLVIDALPLATSGAPQPSVLHGIADALEAGLFEEVLFRSVLIGLPLAVIPLLTTRPPKWWPWIPIVIAAVLFTAAHPESATPADRAWYLLAGTALGRLFVSKGLLSAVIAHTLVDIAAVALP